MATTQESVWSTVEKNGRNPLKGQGQLLIINLKTIASTVQTTEEEAVFKVPDMNLFSMSKATSGLSMGMR
jgi:hypothetical protein